MFKENSLKKYKISGVDCPVCASGIESALQSQPGMENSRLDFAGGILYLNPEYLDHAQKIIAEKEPDAVVQTGDETKEIKLSLYQKIAGKELLRIIIAGIMFAAGLFPIPNVWKTVLFIASYVIVGFPVVIAAFKNIFRGKFMDELFLMTVASAGAIAIGELPEAAAVMLFYSFGEYLQGRAVARSRASIEETMNLRNIRARVMDGDEFKEVNPADVHKGSVIEILPGDTVPLDGTVIEGSTWVNTSALTGESVLRRAEAGDEILAGYVNDEGRILVKTARPYNQSAMARVKALLEEAASRKAPTERILTRFASAYTPTVVVLALLLAFLPPAFGLWPLRESVYKAMILLVISCPCALVVSVPMAYFAGIGRASKDKILLKGADVLDAAAKVDTVVFDKTGTLTEGKFRVQKIYSAGEWSQSSLISLAAAVLSSSRHPIARSIEEYSQLSNNSGSSAEAVFLGQASASQSSLLQITVQKKDLKSIKERRGLGVEALLKGKKVLAGSARLLSEAGVNLPALNIKGSVVHLALDTQYLGTIELSDALKEMSVPALENLRKMGIKKTVLLTGDIQKRAEETAKELGINKVEASLLPQDKMSAMEKIMAKTPSGKKTAYAGDGLNDAPVILRADLGMAMGHGGSDMAIEAADAVFMDDNPLRIPLLFKIGRFTRSIVLQNIWFALAIKVALMAAGVFAGLPMWAAVLGDTGVALLAVANSLRVLMGRKKLSAMPVLA